MTCLFGISFIILGNMFANCINFAVQACAAGGDDSPSNGKVRGIAVSVATLACFIHVFSRRGGILLNNMFATVKVGILLLIVITAIVVGAGGFEDTPNVISDNTSPSKSFDGVSTGSNAFSKAFLNIIFAVSGFEQANYVLGEIGKPRQKFPVAQIRGVGIVLACYIAVNISYVRQFPPRVLARTAITHTICRWLFFPRTTWSGITMPNVSLSSRLAN